MYICNTGKSGSLQNAKAQYEHTSRTAHTHTQTRPASHTKKEVLKSSFVSFHRRTPPQERTTCRPRAKPPPRQMGQMDAQAENGGSRFQQKQKTTAPKSGPPPHPKNPLGSSDSTTQQSSYNYEKTKGPTAGRSEGRGSTLHRHPPHPPGRHAANA